MITSTNVPNTHARMTMDSSNGCQISMLLNWNTINTCFLSSAFQVRSPAAFFAVCISSFSLVLLLEFVRRLQRNLDVSLRARYQRLKYDADGKELQDLNDQEPLVERGAIRETLRSKTVKVVEGKVVIEQIIRGVVHMVQFAISYCVMLLVMYSNGYVIISICLGALVGFSLFTRDMITMSKTRSG